MNKLKMIDVYAGNDSIVTEVADTYGLRCYWGSSRRILGDTIEDTFSILREINVDGYKVVLSVQASMWNNKLVYRNVGIIADECVEYKIKDKDRVIFEVENFIDVVSSDMSESFDYLYENIVYAILDLVGYVTNEDLGKGVNLADVPDNI